MRKLIPLIAVVVVVLAGCRAEVELGLDVESEGSGTLGFEVGMDDQLASFIESTGQDVDEILGEVPEGATALEPREEGGLTIYGFTRPFATPDGAAALINQGVDGAGIDTQASNFDLSVADGGAALDATFEFPDVSEEAGDFGGLAESLEGAVSASIRVHLPGAVVESNADRTLADGSLAWDIPLAGGTVVVQARSEAGGGGFPVVPVAVAAGVVALGAGLWALSRRGKGGAAAIEGTPIPSAPTSVYGEVTTPATYRQAVDEVIDPPPADPVDPDSSGPRRPGEADTRD
ncbi:MAG: hypothetical protein ACR2JP_05785 [Acidimicrobiia bacterium]